MKPYLIFLAFLFLVPAAGCKNEKKEKETFSYEQPNASASASSENAEAPKPSEMIDLSTKGIGPVTQITLSPDVDAAMADRGKAIFNRNCTVCHTADQRLVGPAMTGITQKRTPEWIMNMVINPQKMAMQDPLAKALLEEYKQAIMPNQGITQEQARELLEYFRTL